MWGLVLSLLLAGSGVAFIVLGLQTRHAAEAAQAAKLFKWVPQASTTESFLNSSSFNFAMDAPEYTSFYLWNLTNAEELLAGRAQPKLQQVGPYAYEKRSRKLNVQFHAIGDDAYDASSYGAVSYQVATTYHFSSERSNGSESDLVVTVNASYVRRLTKIHAQSGRSERFLAAEFAHAHIRDYAKHLQTDFLAATKLRALRALLPDMVSAVRREGMDAVIIRQQQRIGDANLPAALVRMHAVARTEQIPVMLRDVYRDQADIAIPGLLTAQYALARRQALPRVLSNVYNRLQVEGVPTLLGQQMKAQQANFVPRTLNSLNLKLQRIAFPYVLQEVFERACLEAVPFLLRAIKTHLVAQNIANRATADDAQLAVVQLWRSQGSTPSDLDAWIDDSPTGKPRTGFELLPASSDLQLSLEVATLLLGSRGSNLRFSLVDYDATQTATNGLSASTTTAVGFAIWKQVVALNDAAIAYVLDGVNNDVALPSDYLTRAQLMAVRDYIIGWAQSNITLRDRQRFWRKAFAKRSASNDVSDPDVDLDLERTGVQSGFSLIPLSSSSAAPVNVAVAQQVWNASIAFSFVNPVGFSKWISVVDGVATASAAGLLTGITGITASEVTAISGWITAMLADGFIRRRALLHWTSGTCLSVMQMPRSAGCLRYDLEPNIDGQQLGFEMNPTAVAAISAGVSIAAREKLWDATASTVSFLILVHPSNTATGYGQWLLAIRTTNFARLIASSPDITTLAVTVASAQAIGAWLNGWADNDLNRLAVYYWWLRSTCWPRQVSSKVLASTTTTSNLADCAAASSEQELATTSSTIADASPFSTFVKTFQVTEDVCSSGAAPFTRTRTVYTLTATVFSCDATSTGLADDLDDNTKGFELTPLAQTASDRISLAAAMVLWNATSLLSFRNTTGYQRWAQLAASISTSTVTAAADTQALVTDLNAAITLLCKTPIVGGGVGSGVFNVSMVASACTAVTTAHVTRLTAWVSEQSGSAWVKNTLLDQWRRGAAGSLDIEPYRDGLQSGLELATGCETTLSSLTLAQCQAIATDSGTKYEVPRDALKLWDVSNGASFLTATGYSLWDALALAVGSGSATAIAASQAALATVCSSGASSTWAVWMERVFQWITRWKINEHLQRDVLGHWLYASCPTTPTTKAVISEPAPASSTVSSCSASYTATLASSVADLQQLASRPVAFFDANVVQNAALVNPRKTVVVNEAWTLCTRLSASSYTRTTGTRQSQKEYQACNLLSVLATPAVSASDVAPLDAMFELNRSAGADITLEAAKVLWDAQSTFSLLNSTAFFNQWYDAIDRPAALQQSQTGLNALVSGVTASNLAALQSYLKQWEDSDSAASSVASSWVSVNPASVDVDVHAAGDQRGFELYRNSAYFGSAVFVTLPTLAQAKALWRTDSLYSLVRNDNNVDAAGLPTGFRAWAEMYEGTDWESEWMVDQYPLKNQVSRPPTTNHTLSDQQRAQLLAAMMSTTTLSEVQIRGLARWLLNWATDGSARDFMLYQWATGETFRGDSTLSLDLASHLQRLYAFPVTSDMARDPFTAASTSLAGVSRESLRKLWNVSISGSLLDPATRVVWCMLNATDNSGKLRAPCAHLLDGYGQLEQAAFDDFVAVVQPTIANTPIVQGAMDLAALARNFLIQALGLTAAQITTVVNWYRNVADASLFFKVFQLDHWSTAVAKPSPDPLEFGFQLAFVLPWNTSIPRNVTTADLVANVAVMNGSTGERSLANCDRSLSLFYTLWDASNVVSFLHPTGVANWLAYVRGEISAAKLYGGVSASNPTAKVISVQLLSDTSVSCLFQLVGHWLKSWSNHPSARMFVEDFWVSPVTQGASAATALLPAASDMARAFLLKPFNANGGKPGNVSTTDWWTTTAQIVLNVAESSAFSNPGKGFALWRPLLVGCFSSNRATGKCQQPDNPSTYSTAKAKALEVLSRSLQARIVTVSTAFSGVSDTMLLNYTSSMLQQQIVPWLVSLLDHTVLEQYILERVRLANGDDVLKGPVSFVDLAAVQFVNGSVSSANYVVSDSSTGDLILADRGLRSERYPREDFVFDPQSGVVVKQNSSFSPGFGELLAFCNATSQDRRFTYDANTSCSLGVTYSFSISEAQTLWTAFGFNDTTTWAWPAPRIDPNATGSGVPLPSPLPDTFRLAVLLDVFLAQPFDTADTCQALVAPVAKAYAEWSDQDKQQICVDRTGETGVGPKAVYIRFPTLKSFNLKPVSYIHDMQAYLLHAATKFGYEPSILGLSPSVPAPAAAPSLVYPVGGYFASLAVSKVLFGVAPGGTLTETPLWPNATTSERAVSSFDVMVPLKNDATLYEKSKSVVGRLLAVDNRSTMNTWGENVKLDTVRVTDGSQFTTAIRIGQGENTAAVEFPPQKLYFFWPYARRVAQVSFDSNTTRFGVSLMRYRVNWSLSRLPTGIVTGVSTPSSDTLNMSVLNDDLPLVLQSSSSSDSPVSVIDIDPDTGAVLHRRFVWQLTARVGDGGDRPVLDVWHSDVALGWLPVVWIQEEVGVTATTSTQLTALGPLTPNNLSILGIVGGSCVIAASCVIAYISIKRARLVRLQRFTSIVPEGSSAVVVNGSADVVKPAEEIPSPDDVDDIPNGSTEAVQTILDQTEGIDTGDAGAADEIRQEATTRAWMHRGST